MSGYPYIAASIFLFCLVGPSSVSKSHRIVLPKTLVKADRTSPAFSAIEDAFVIRELSHSKEKNQEKKIDLKGLKISATTPESFKRIDLKGERIGVVHFTNRFILKKSPPKNIALGGVNEVDLITDLKSVNLASSNKRVKKIGPVTISLPEAEKSNQKMLSASSSHQNLHKVELPSGVTLTKLVERLEGKPNKRETGAVASVTPQTVSVFQSKSEIQKSNLISGEVELEGDLVGENLVYHIERRLDGRVFETGVVDANNSDEFQMELSSMQGLISVELRTEAGEVLAYGEKKLNESSLRDKIRVKIYPSETSFSGRVLSALDSVDEIEEPLPSAGGVVSGVAGELAADDQGYFNEEIFEKGSSFIVQTSAKDYWSDLKFGVSGKPLYPRLIDKETFRDFAKTLDPFGEEVEVTSALVGHVSQKGLSQSNLKIKILNHEYEKPVYFNEIGSANPRLASTTNNGGFIFINLADGAYLVQALRGEKVVAQKWFLVREGHISQGQLRADQNPVLIASAETFPEQKNEEVFSIYESGLSGINHPLSSAKETAIKTVTTPEILSLNIEASDHHKEHIYMTSSKSIKKRFKVVKTAWLDQFLAFSRSNANRAKPFIIGFMKKEDFAVVQDASDSMSQNSRVLYFDKNGDRVESGLAGGGFVITDAEVGLGSVVLKIRGKDTYLNKMVLAKPNRISIF